MHKVRVLGIGLVVTLSGCMSAQLNDSPQNGQGQEEVNFIREKPSDAPDMLAITEGQLVLKESCLYIQGDGDPSHAAIWPFDFSVALQNDTIQILNGSSEYVAQVGQRIRISGGELPQISSEEFAAGYIGEECTSPYWVVNSDIEVVSP